MYERSREIDFDASKTEDEEVGLVAPVEKNTEIDLSTNIEALKAECPHVLADPDNAEMLKQLISDANEFADAETAGKWKALLDETRQSLRNEDEGDAITDTLREAITKGLELAK